MRPWMLVLLGILLVAGGLGVWLAYGPDCGAVDVAARFRLYDQALGDVNTLLDLGYHSPALVPGLQETISRAWLDLSRPGPACLAVADSELAVYLRYILDQFGQAPLDDIGKDTPTMLMMYRVNRQTIERCYPLCQVWR